jgi:hypothetical protein
MPNALELRRKILAAKPYLREKFFRSLKKHSEFHDIPEGLLPAALQDSLKVRNTATGLQMLVAIL